MEIDGIVHNGVVVLDTESPLPDGTRVKVTAQISAPPVLATHYDLLREVIGRAEGLPEDFAKNHDHYIRGGPKQ